MKIAICSSLDFTFEIKETADKLTEMGHIVTIPFTTKLILNGEIESNQIQQEKENGDISERIIKQDSFRYYYNKIKESDAILVLNATKKGIDGYIGGAVFLEMGFAHILNKKIFLMNNIPKMHYTDEINGMQPTVINGNLSQI